MTRSSQARARRRRAWRAAAANGAGRGPTTSSEPVDDASTDAASTDAASTDEASSPTANGAPAAIAIDAAASVAPLDDDTASDPADDESDSTEAVDRDVAEPADDEPDAAEVDAEDSNAAETDATADEESETEAEVPAAAEADAEVDAVDDEAETEKPSAEGGADTEQPSAQDETDGGADTEEPSAQDETDGDAPAAAATDAEPEKDTGTGSEAPTTATASDTASEAGTGTAETEPGTETDENDAETEARGESDTGAVTAVAAPAAGVAADDRVEEPSVAADTKNVDLEGSDAPTTDPVDTAKVPAAASANGTASPDSTASANGTASSDTASSDSTVTTLDPTPGAEAEGSPADRPATTAVAVLPDEGGADAGGGEGDGEATTPTTAAAAAPAQTVPHRRWGVALVLNRIGRGLIAAGVVILLFVGYQLWGTNIQESRSQDKLQSAFDDKLAQLEDADPSVLDALRGTGSSTTAAPGAAPTTPTTISREVFDLIAPQAGEPVAVIRIPQIGVERRVVEGTDVEDLRQGPGHYAESPLPGQAGNAAIAGHRTTYGAPFNRIDELVPGDEIQVQTVQGTAIYKVDQAPFVVTPDQVEVLDDYGDNRLTLTSCHPKLSSSKRMIVTAQLEGEPFPPLPSDAAPVAADVASTTTIPDAVENPGATNTTAPTVTAPGATVTTDVPEPGPPVTSTVPATTSASSGAATTGSATSGSEGDGEGDQATLGGPDSQANLDQGLAGDRSALPSAIGWGVVTLALVVLAWLAACAFERRVHVPRHGRRLIVYVLASPIVLFFLFLCFENVDRLLPAY